MTSPNGLSTQSQLLFYDVEVGPVAPLNLNCLCLSIVLNRVVPPITVLHLNLVPILLLILRCIKVSHHHLVSLAGPINEQYPNSS